MSESHSADPIELPDIDEPLGRLRAGDVFVELRHEDVAARAAGLDAVLRQFADSDTKLLWISNPLRSPLTIERLFLQAAGPEADLRIERNPEELAGMLRAAAQNAARCLLVVHQPETLDAEARDALAAVAPLLAGAVPTIQFLFCGSSAFRPIAVPAAALMVPPAISLEGPRPRLVPASAPRSTGRLNRPLLVALAVLALLTTASITDPKAPRLPSQTATASATATATAISPAPDRPLPSEHAASVPEPTPPGTDVAALRREFDTFLAQQSPRLARLTPDQRDALFDEFLQRQARRDASPPN